MLQCALGHLANVLSYRFRDLTLRNPRSIRLHSNNFPKAKVRTQEPLGEMEADNKMAKENTQERREADINSDHSGFLRGSQSLVFSRMNNGLGAFTGAEQSDQCLLCTVQLKTHRETYPRSWVLLLCSF